MIVDQTSQDSVEKNSLEKKLIDASPVEHRFGRQHNPREAEPVAKAEAETRTMHDVAIVKPGRL
jgi:hypothetical protein